MNYAIIENGVVTNMIVGLPDGMDGIQIDGTNAGIGDKYENGEFIKPEPPEPIIDPSIALQERVAELEAALAEIEEAVNG